MPAVHLHLDLWCDRCGAELELHGYADGVVSPLSNAQRFAAEHASCVYEEREPGRAA